MKAGSLERAIAREAVNIMKSFNDDEKVAGDGSGRRYPRKDRDVNLDVIDEYAKTASHSVFNELCQSTCMQSVSETFAGYQLLADRFRQFTADSDYPWDGLVEEVGKLYRVKSKVSRGDYSLSADEVKEKITGEIGDILWNLAAICTKYGIDFAQVAVGNLNKLEQRRENGTLLSKKNEKERQ